MECWIARNKNQCDYLQLVVDVLKMSDRLGFIVPLHQCKGCIGKLELPGYHYSISCACTLDDHEFTEDAPALASAVECSWLQRVSWELPQKIPAVNADG
jgi:hypothetical protein